MLDYSAVVSRTGPTRNGVSIVGGPDQIRTGVEAFAELCLATRLQDRACKCNTNSIITKFAEINLWIYSFKFVTKKQCNESTNRN